jgi:CelD/BcsL family acetyltransferase involved in cellulose biosynthesis
MSEAHVISVTTRRDTSMNACHDLLRLREPGDQLVARQRWYSALDACLYQSSRITERVGAGLPELQALESHWRTLAAGQVPTRFMHAFEWQMAWLRNLAEDSGNVCYVSFFVGGRPIAIFPLCRVQRSAGRITMWLWESPKHPHLILSEPLISPEWAGPELFRRLMAVLARFDSRPWDALHLPNLLEGSVATRLLQAKRLRGLHLERTASSMYFNCSDMETALANCSNGFKRNLRRQGKRLAERGRVEFQLIREGDGLEAAFEDFLRLEASGWKGGSGRNSAILLHPRLLGFYGDLKAGYSARGACVVALLKLDGVAIAAQFGLLSGGTLYIQKIAYDEFWHAEAPGSQLMLKVLAYCCDDPEIDQLSLVTGPQWAVGRWNPESLGILDAYLFRATARGLGGLAMRRFKTGIWLPMQELLVGSAGS